MRQAANEKTLATIKNSHLDSQSQLATLTSEKSQLEFRLQQAQAQLADAQQISQQRVAEAVTEKAAKDRVQDELDKATATIKKLNERQEVANSTNATVGEIQLKDERDKLMVGLFDPSCWAQALTIAETATMQLLSAELQAADYQPLWTW